MKRRIICEYLEQMFLEKWVDRGLAHEQSLCLPDIIPLDSCWWGNFKLKFYSRQSQPMGVNTVIVEDCDNIPQSNLIELQEVNNFP